MSDPAHPTPPPRPRALLTDLEAAIILDARAELARRYAARAAAAGVS